LNKADTRLGKERFFEKKLRIMERKLRWDNNLTDEKLGTSNRTTMTVQSEKEITQNGSHST
jgi:hypothetical protein